MNQTQSADPTSDMASRTNELTVLDLLIAIARRRKLIVRLSLAAAVVLTAVSFALPNVYVASTKLLPPQQGQSNAAALLSQLGGVASMAAGVTGLKNPSDMYVGMLKSRTIADSIIAKYDLRKVYGTESQEKARKILEKNTNIDVGKDGLIVIEVEDENKKIVAAMANAYAAELSRLTKVLAVTEASQRRVFFEQQLQDAKNNLATAESTLKGTLDKRGVISVDSESKALVETVARLRAQASVKEIQLNSMRAFITSSNPEYQRVEQELASLRRELSKLENGSSAPGAEVEANGTPQRGFESIKGLRDVKYYQMLYELLAKQYEIAKLDEAKDPAIIQVLDAAVEPERKSKPHRVLIVLGGTFGVFFLTILWALFSAVKQRALLEPNVSEQVRELKAQWRG